MMNDDSQMENVFINRLATFSSSNSRFADRQLAETFEGCKTGREDQDLSENYFRGFKGNLMVSCDTGVGPVYNSASEVSSADWKASEPPLNVEVQKLFFRPFYIFEEAQKTETLAKTQNKDNQGENYPKSYKPNGQIHMLFENCEEEIINPYFCEMSFKCSRELTKEFKNLKNCFGPKNISPNNRNDQDQKTEPGFSQIALLSEGRLSGQRWQLNEPGFELITKSSNVWDYSAQRSIDIETNKASTHLGKKKIIMAECQTQTNTTSSSPKMSLGNLNDQEKNKMPHKIKPWWKLSLRTRDKTIKVEKTLWKALCLNEDAFWDRIRKDFVSGEELHLISEARGKLMFVPELKEYILKKENLRQNCNDKVRTNRRVLFSEDVEVIFPKEIFEKDHVLIAAGVAPKGILKTNDTRQRQSMDRNMWRWVELCENQIHGSRKTCGLDDFNSVASFFKDACEYSFLSYIEVAEEQSLNYNHYLAQISNAVNSTLDLLAGIGDLFTLHVDTIKDADKDGDSLLDAANRSKNLVQSVPKSGDSIQYIEKALKVLTSADYGYVETMVDIANTGEGTKVVRDVQEELKLHSKLILMGLTNLQFGFGEEKFPPSLSGRNPSE
ncbi:hypothetical protein METBIDRAFT_9291 [Metschnikowia bicuspidata var. bicuspidata NRRL YB-4993]|uniref:Uncharacterized protein n=1 Tax=Metschnikowia bicuspidata var. bicuspidata NRRL YB-4993 TaxID=869754 RepID=A0A1A0HFL9_9ASCO|nr:hypothetical protein METBIDRAFT_9291 [Metschnikowia bicuspidata var. bicuspidata NRRL YB-4993]OBA22949.1 hypothetical protein METBIDRAFT_9291 [Metschnikowia bicuspidata var. bicuspidata NRRL YB-4993]